MQSRTWRFNETRRLVCGNIITTLTVIISFDTFILNNFRVVKEPQNSKHDNQSFLFSIFFFWGGGEEEIETLAGQRDKFVIYWRHKAKADVAGQISYRPSNCFKGVVWHFGTRRCSLSRRELYDEGLITSIHRSRGSRWRISQLRIQEVNCPRPRKYPGT